MTEEKNMHNEFEMTPVASKNIWKFVIASLVGVFLFLIPVPKDNTFTIPIGIVIDYVTGWLKTDTINWSVIAVMVFTTISAVVTIINMIFKPKFISDHEALRKLFTPQPLYFVSRIIGLVVVYMVYFKVGPKMIYSDSTGGSMMGVASTLVSVVLCIAFTMPLLTGNI